MSEWRHWLKRKSPPKTGRIVRKYVPCTGLRCTRPECRKRRAEVDARARNIQLRGTVAFGRRMARKLIERYGCCL